MRSSPFAAAVVAATSLFFVIVTVGLAFALGHDWVAMLRDRVGPQETQPALAGFVSDLGIFMLFTATVVYVVHAIRHRHLTLLVFFTAALSAMIALDDYWMLHEGEYEKAFYASYMVAGIGLVFLQVRHALHESWLLMSALVVLGISMLADFVHVDPQQQILSTSVWKLRALAEDALKFTGYALLSAHLVADAVDAIARRGHRVATHR